MTSLYQRAYKGGKSWWISYTLPSGKRIAKNLRVTRAGCPGVASEVTRARRIKFDPRKGVVKAFETGGAICETPILAQDCP